MLRLVVVACEVGLGAGRSLFRLIDVEGEIDIAGSAAASATGSSLA